MFLTDRQNGVGKRITLLRLFPFALIFSTVLGLLSACAGEPAALREVFPLMPTSLDDPPPPAIQVLINVNRAKFFELPLDADSLAETASRLAAMQARLLDGEIGAPGVVLLADQPPDLEQERSENGDDEAGEEAPTVTVRNENVNIRSGPGLGFSTIDVAPQGETFEALGRTESGEWWQICCVPRPDEEAEEATGTAWISDIVVTPNEAALELPVLGPLFPDDLEAEWVVDYTCGSDRCEVKQCTAMISADVRNAEDEEWLEIERRVNWNDGCGEDSTWLHQIERIQGTERYGSTSDFFLFDFWAGADSGPINGLFSLNPDAQVKTWCSDAREIKLEEGEGWTTRYIGMTCHDVRTGMLVSMKYTKRWLFTGTFEGEEYDAAYFGDYEVYEVRLIDTNAELALVQ